MKYLLLKGCAGLGNRLITILKAIEYANSNDRTLYIDWSDGMFAERGQNVFYKYFNLKNVSFIDTVSKINESIKNGSSCYPPSFSNYINDSIYDHYKINKSHLGSIPLYKYLLSKFIKGEQAQFWGLPVWVNIDNSLKKKEMFPLGGCLSKNLKEDVVLFADFRPSCNIDKLTNHITLKPDILKSFNDYANNKNLNHAIGVHIRATDKSFNKEERVFKKINSLLKEDPELIIFLSTDNLKVSSEFELRYPQKIVFYPKYLPDVEGSGLGIHRWASRNGNTELKESMLLEALADMYLLSKCKYLLWQGNSSFSYISKILKNDKEKTFDWMKCK